MSRAEEYLRRMRERGYQDSLAGMDDDDIEYELEKMDRGANNPPAPQLGRTFQPPDRDFAERIFKMFKRPFDPNWKMPNLDGPEYRQTPKPGPGFAPAIGGVKRPDEVYNPWEAAWRPDWGGGENPLRQDGTRTMEYRPGRDDAFLPSRGTMERTLSYRTGGDNAGSGMQPMSATTDNPYAGGYADGGAYGDMTLPGASPQTDNKDAGMKPSENLVGFLKKYEKFEPKSYFPTPNDSLTIGFGHKIRPGEDFSNGISEEDALKLLAQDMKEHADAINRLAAENNVKLTQQQFDALVSLRFNVGSLSVAPKLMAHIISGNATPEQIRKEMEDIISDEGGPKPGLWRRRRDEADMFFHGDYSRKYPQPPKDLFPNF